jgi:hypothetical protein
MRRPSSLVKLEFELPELFVPVMGGIGRLVRGRDDPLGIFGLAFSRGLLEPQAILLIARIELHIAINTLLKG